MSSPKDHLESGGQSSGNPETSNQCSLKSSIEGSNIAEGAEIGRDLISGSTVVTIFNGQMSPSEARGEAEEAARTSEDSEDDSVKDPTSPLAERGSSFAHDPDDLARWLDKLRRYRFLVLECEDPQVLTDAGYALVERLTVEDRRVLRFDGEDRGDFDPTFRMLYDGTIKTNSPSLVMVMANVPQARGFVSTMPIGDPTAIHALADKGLDRYVLILGTRKTLALSEIYQDYREVVGYLQPRLRFHYPKEFENLHEKLLRQIQQGRWAENPRELFQQISSTFRDGCLGKELERREHSQLDREAKVQALNEARTLLSSKDELKNTVLFVATYFSGLPARDFEAAVLCLLGDMEVEIKATLGFGDEGQAWSSGQDEKRYLRDLWSENHREVLDACHLDFQQPKGLVVASDATDGPRVPVAGFTDEHLSEALDSVFWTSAYKVYLDLLERVFTHKLFFEHQSEAVMEGVIQLLVRTAKEDRELHGQHWLLHLIPGSVVESGSNSESKRIRQAINEIGWTRYCYRMKNLILEMLSHEDLQGVVSSFLNKLIHLYVLGAARELIWRLRSTDRIDVFPWWQRLLDRGSSKTVRSVCRNIIDSGWEGRQRHIETLLRVGEWLPDPNRPATKNSEAVASGVIIGLCLKTTLTERESPLAIWPPTNQILKNLLGDRGQALGEVLFSALARAEVAEVLGGSWHSLVHRFFRIRVLSHEARKLWPGKEGVLAGEMVSNWEGSGCHDPEQAAPYLFQSMILADWALDLVGFEDEVPEEAALQLRRVVESILRTFDFDGRRALFVHWTNLTRLQKDLLVKLTHEADHLVTQDSARQFAQAQGRLSREIGILRDLANEVWPFSVGNGTGEPDSKAEGAVPDDHGEVFESSGSGVSSIDPKQSDRARVEEAPLDPSIKRPDVPQPADEESQPPVESTPPPRTFEAAKTPMHEPSIEAIPEVDWAGDERFLPDGERSPVADQQVRKESPEISRSEAGESQDSSSSSTALQPDKAPSAVETSSPQGKDEPAILEIGAQDQGQLSPDSMAMQVKPLPVLRPPDRRANRPGLIAAVFVGALGVLAAGYSVLQNQSEPTTSEPRPLVPTLAEESSQPFEETASEESESTGGEPEPTPGRPAPAPDPAPTPPPATVKPEPAQSDDLQRARALLAEGQKLQREDRRLAARDAYARATRLAPENAYTWANLGAAEMLLGNEGRGEQAYRRALEVDGDNWLARYNLGTHLARTGRRSEALEQLDRATSILRRQGERQHLENLRRDMESNSAFLELRNDKRFQRLLGS